MTKPLREKYLKIGLAVWGASLGFPVGVALTALLGKRFGWWPSSPQHLLKSVENFSEKAQKHV